MVSQLKPRCGHKSLLCLVCIMATSPLLADSYPRPDGYRIAHYMFDVEIGDGSDEIRMKEIVRIEVLAPNITRVKLELCGPRLPGPSEADSPDVCRRDGGGARAPTANSEAPADPTGMIVTEATIDGHGAMFDQTSNRVRVQLPGTVAPGQQLRLSLSYHGRPAAGLNIGTNTYGDRYFYAMPWPDRTHHWLATIDHPSVKVPKTLTVTAPAKYQVVSNGLLIQQLDLPDGRRRTTWDEKVPLAAGAYSFAAAPYALDRLGDFRGIDLSTWLIPQERDRGFAAFRATTEPVLEYIADRVGSYPYMKLAQIQVPRPGLALELGSSIIYGYDDAPGPNVIAHEIAHQWFGTSVTPGDWDDLWLSEGFATYFALLYEDHAMGRDAFRLALRRSANEAVRYSVEHPESTIVHPNLANIAKVLANKPQIYEGGAQVLHMLRGILGNETFWNGIRTYYARFRDSTASTEDLRRAMQEACSASPSCPDEAGDLRWFFDQWLTRGGLPSLQGRWRYDRAAKGVRISLEQRHAGAPYRLPIDVALLLPATRASDRDADVTADQQQSAARVTRLVIEQREQQFFIACDVAPHEVVLDPELWATLVQLRPLRQQQ